MRPQLSSVFLCTLALIMPATAHPSDALDKFNIAVQRYSLPGCRQPFGKWHTNQQKRTWIEDHGRCFDFPQSDTAPFASFDYKWKPWNPHREADRAIDDPLIPTKKEHSTDTKRYCAIKAYEGKNCQGGMTLISLANSWDNIEKCFDVFADQQGSPSWAQSMRIACRWGKGGYLFNKDDPEEQKPA